MSGLQGKAIVVTRAPHQADALALLLAEAGAMPALLSMRGHRAAGRSCAT